MHGTTTRTTLLLRLRDADDPSAWQGLEQMYRPMLLRVCRARGLQPADAEDVVQAVFVGLVRGLRTFEYDPAKGRFRNYLLRSLSHAMADWANWRSRENHVRSHGNTGSRNETEHIGATFEREWVNHHYCEAIATVLQTCDPRSVEIFHAAMAGREVPDIAATLGMNPAAVYKALARTRERLRETIAEQVRREDACGE